MRAFEYVAPASAADAVRALSEREDACVLAGGTDLLNRMKDDVSAPGRVVYIRDLAELRGCQNGDSYKIGSNTTLAALASDPVLSEKYPALVQAAAAIGTPQIRNMATLGGNLAQRPRCWYFRSGFGLLSKSEAHPGCMAKEGDNRYHAIFMTDGEAVFVAPSGLAPALIALGAQATILGPSGERVIAVEDLYVVPKAAGEKELSLKPGEILTGVTLPPAKGKSATYEVRWKQSHDWPLALASVCVQMDGGKVSASRIVLGSVAPIPWRSKEAEAVIAGKAIDRDSAAAAAAEAVKLAKPLSMNAYKVQLAKVAVQRALLSVVGDCYWEA